jgi:hypothetical protein
MAASRRDPKRKHITITKRLFWFFESTRQVPFDKIRRIHYQWKDLKPWFLRGQHVHDSLDCFSVRLTLWEEHREVHLFSFIGEGVAVNQSALPDWMVGLTFERDWAGTQSRQSRYFVALLEEYTGLELVA